MDNSNEGEAISPGGGEVLNIDIGVLVGGETGPSKKGLLGCKVLALANHDVRDLGVRERER